MRTRLKGARRSTPRTAVKQIFPLMLLCCMLTRQAIAQNVSTRLDEVLDHARQAQAANHYAEAAAAYAEATAIDRSVPELWANRGLMEYLSGHYGESIVSLKQASALKPSLFVPHLFLGMDELELNKPESALPHLERASALMPSDAQPRLALGRAYMALHNPRAAAEAYAEAAAIDHANHAAWYGLGVASISLIEQDGGTLAARQPDSVWSRTLYADELILQGRVKEAADNYQEVAKRATPEQRAIFITTLRHMRDAQPGGGMTPPQWDQMVTTLQSVPVENRLQCSISQRALQKMACAYWQNRPDTTALLAARYLQQHADDAQALFWSVKANERRAVDALAHFEELAPHSAATFDLLGDLYRRRMQPDSALNQYDKALALSPHDSGALLGRAAALLSIGKFDKAAETARQGLIDGPNDPRLNLLLAESLVDSHKLVEAQPFLDRAVGAATDKDADSSVAALGPRAHALRGRVEGDAGEIDAAIADMQLGLSSDRDGSLSFQLSRLYRRAGRMREAAEAEAHAKQVQAQRRANAVIAVQDFISHQSE